MNESNKSIIVVDEIQKVPQLMDEVHLLIESNKQFKFILTGGSARKLKKKGVNLLGGRVYPIYFHPLTSKEIKNTSVSLNKMISLIIQL